MQIWIHPSFAAADRIATATTVNADASGIAIVKRVAAPEHLIVIVATMAVSARRATVSIASKKTASARLAIV